ncbi:hypothetical protein [Tropicibacter sp. Alg240-R139]|uniref:hypothetical protein n=1 Tax=Tropicibacter sp. Alg240-R139 TaxID=2305991 RepID=UPI0013E04C43|nr:hypothetical protein [Tropicibacter sp. Alg240-R139]
MITSQFQAVTLSEGEQIVFSEQSRVLPILKDAIYIAIFAPTLMLMPWLTVHRMFRRSVYLVTTQRVLVVEPDGVVGEIGVSDIVGFRGTRSSLLIIGGTSRLWLPRLHDAWRFETIVQRVIERV